ncbi:IS21-like element helper ATPase IstB [Nannocystis exedens]|uniref:IS21-like element helper ATPase IstB n=1 Tax=Nannocystis exedens TaxID=54 RepID=UPI000BB9FE71|nr:IS21-like element helper ATPase IstB [Nannocystis exedens]PCC73499.1 ATPase AAA [Nannocystis exedens]
MTTNHDDPLRRRAAALGLHGVLTHWHTHAREPWLQRLIEIEEVERKRRNYERRLRDAQLSAIKPLAEFDWKHPKKIDQGHIQELFQLHFLRDATNVVFIGPNGVGKTMLAQNLALHALGLGHTARFVSASAMLTDLASQDGALALKRPLHRFAKPELLVVDEVGDLSYSDRSADLLFEVLNQRYGRVSTVVTTNRPFSEWSAIFPNATCVGTLVDRLCHHAEIVEIAGDSYRLKEAKDRRSRRSQRANTVAAE